MSNINIKIFLWIFVPLSILIWFIILLFSGTPLVPTWPAISKVPLVITVELLLYALFAKWGWRISFLQGWLVPFPILEGSWRGQIQSTWEHGEAISANPLACVLVIKQSFLHTSCTLFTRESSSSSDKAAFILEPESNEKSLTYSYTNTPQVGVRDRSHVHRGTALLRIVNKPGRELLGEYWTNRGSAGSMEFKFETYELWEKFPEDTSKS